MSGAPCWTDNETFDINATTADHAEMENPQQFQQLILSLLEDRFQLKSHRVQKEPSSVDPSLNAVLKEQLGLKLQPARGVIEILVIDRIARPSAN